MRLPMDLLEHPGMRLRNPRVELEQPNLVGRLIPKELDVEGAVVQSDLRDCSTGHVGHAELHFLRQPRRVLVAGKGGAARLANAVHHPVDDRLPFVDVALQGALAAPDNALCQTILFHRQELPADVEGVQQIAEGLVHESDALPQALHGRLKLDVIVDLESQVAAKGLKGLDPIRRNQRDALPGGFVERVKGMKTRDVVGDDFLLLQPAPVLMLALDDAFQTGTRQTEALGEYGHEVGAGEVVEGADSTGLAGVLLDGPHRLVDQELHIKTLDIADVADIERGVKLALLPAG